MSEAQPDLVFDSPTAMKVATAKQHKESGDQAFKLGKTTEALMAYHQALLYLNGLDRNALAGIGINPTPDSTKEKPKTEVDEIVEKIYANQSACHIKNKNWKRAVETADKALSKNAENTKALFRKAVALGEQGFFDKSVKVLEEVKKKDASETARVDQEITRLKALDDERERKHRKKLKGFLNKAEKKESTETDEIKPAFIEEVPDDK